jgi:disulfide bond formation protein DsbB
MTGTLGRSSLIVALAAAWVAMLGSLYFSEVLHWTPCTLCWYQRILMYPLTLVLLVGILRKDDGVPFYVLPLSILGILVSTYHYLLQKTDLFQESAACAAGVPCSVDYLNLAGFITIPFLALTAFVIITIASVIALSERRAGAGFDLPVEDA